MEMYDKYTGTLTDEAVEALAGWKQAAPFIQWAVDSFINHKEVRDRWHKYHEYPSDADVPVLDFLLDTQRYNNEDFNVKTVYRMLDSIEEDQARIHRWNNGQGSNGGEA